MERPFISDVLQRSIVQQDPKRHTNTPNHTNTNAYISRSPLRGVCQLGDMEIRAPTVHPQRKISVEVHANVGNTYYKRMDSHILMYNTMLQSQLTLPAIITHNLSIQQLETECQLTVSCHTSPILSFIQTCDTFCEHPLTLQSHMFTNHHSWLFTQTTSPNDPVPCSTHN